MILHSTDEQSIIGAECKQQCYLGQNTVVPLILQFAPILQLRPLKKRRRNE
jgi:hypothetical protein